MLRRRRAISCSLKGDINMSQSIFSFTSRPALKDGRYSVDFLNWTPIKDERGNYLSLSLAFPNGSYNQNYFRNGIAIVVSELRAQLGIADDEGELAPEVVLDRAVGKELSVWVTYYVGANGKRSRNIHFAEPTALKAVTDVNFDK